MHRETDVICPAQRGTRSNINQVDVSFDVYFNMVGKLLSYRSKKFLNILPTLLKSLPPLLRLLLCASDYLVLLCLILQL